MPPTSSIFLKEPRRYVFLEDRLELSFNQYEGGPYTVEIPYDRLRPLLRVDGLVLTLRSHMSRSVSCSCRHLRQPAIRLRAGDGRADVRSAAPSMCRVRSPGTLNRNIVGAGDIGRQLEQSLDNLAAALASVGATLDQGGRAQPLHQAKPHAVRARRSAPRSGRSSATIRHARPGLA